MAPHSLNSQTTHTARPATARRSQDSISHDVCAATRTRDDVALPLILRIDVDRPFVGQDEGASLCNAGGRGRVRDGDGERIAPLSSYSKGVASTLQLHLMALASSLVPDHAVSSMQVVAELCKNVRWYSSTHVVLAAAREASQVWRNIVYPATSKMPTATMGDASATVRLRTSVKCSISSLRQARPQSLVGREETSNTSILRKHYSSISSFVDEGSFHMAVGTAATS